MEVSTNSDSKFIPREKNSITKKKECELNKESNVDAETQTPNKEDSKKIQDIKTPSREYYMKNLSWAYQNL